MSDVVRVPLGTLPKRSVPDPILFIFRDSNEAIRNLSGPEWKFVVVIKKGEAGVPTHVDSADTPTSFDLTESDQGRVYYLWGPDDLDEAESTKIQMIAQKEEDVGGSPVVTRRHISDIAVITVATSPASDSGFFV